jgi:hypothetical protein
MRSSSSIAALIAAGPVNSDKHGSEVSNQGTAGVRRAIKDPPAAAVPTTDGRGPGPVWIHPCRSEQESGVIVEEHEAHVAQGAGPMSSTSGGPAIPRNTKSASFARGAKHQDWGM